MQKGAPARGGLNIVDALERASVSLYFAIALLCVWGIYNTIMLYRSLSKKSLSRKAADQFVDQLRELLSKGNLKGAMELCVNPTNWHSALAQLVAVALRNREKGIAKIKQLLVMEFQTEIVSSLENRLASMSTAAKMGPLIGLLGTVVSMIAAFGRMGSGARPDPSALAGSISIGLWSTAVGLLLSNPLMVLANDCAARIRSLRDRTERHLSDVVEILESTEVAGRPAARPAPKAVAQR